VSWPAGTLVEPSILSADFGAFRSQVVELLDAGARAFHVDVMDGHFVPVITFGPRVVSSFAELVRARGGTVDVHLMIEHPERQLAEFARAGANSCTLHAETCPHLHQTLAQIHELGMTAGATVNPGTPTAALHEAARVADLLLCMSVNPGWGGQKFIEASIGRLGELKALLRPGMGLQVDGGVASGTIVRCRQAGANLFVAGNAIYGQPSPGEAWQALTALVADA
jgi:ribulose-phosphate 3-epimerase